MDVAAFLSHLERLPDYQGQMVHLEDVPAREARPGTLEQPLDGRLQQALEGLGVEYLYTHQAEAITALREGKNVIVATPIASRCFSAI